MSKLAIASAVDFCIDDIYFPAKEKPRTTCCFILEGIEKEQTTLTKFPGFIVLEEHLSNFYTIRRAPEVFVSTRGIVLGTNFFIHALTETDKLSGLRL